MSSIKKPLFLFSLPRSGSTMTQRILASHKDIATVSEPWILLPFLYAMRREGTYAEYGHIQMVTALEDFCLELPRGADDYNDAVKELIMQLYAKAAKSDGVYFLDKTPRYHLIADDIISMFPEGKFIFLWRNPLAVVASIIESFPPEKKWSLYKAKIDLFDGFACLVEVCRKHGEKAYAVRYEDLIDNPEAKWSEVFDYLELDYDATVFSNFSKLELEGRMGDPTGIKQYQSVSKEPLEKWKKTISNPFRKAWCRRYLKWIGRERLSFIGYDMDHLLEEVNSIPLGFKYMASDIVRYLFGFIFCFGELTIMKGKISRLVKGRSIYSHR